MDAQPIRFISEAIEVSNEYSIFTSIGLHSTPITAKGDGSYTKNYPIQYEYHRI